MESTYQPQCCMAEKDVLCKESNIEATTGNVLDKAKEANEGGGFQPFKDTRSGRVVQPPPHYDLATMSLTQAEMGYQENLHKMVMLEIVQEYKLSREFAGIGAGLCSGFSNTRELKVMKYEEAMTKDKDGWTKAFDEEHQRMVENYA
eukprot:15356750-Ditylum_brightwellii.AAC.1